MKEINPAECDGQCSSCPIYEKCDGVRLTAAQKYGAVMCGGMVILTAIVLLIAFI